MSVLCTQLGVPVNASDAEIEDAFQNAELSLTVNGMAHQVSASSIKQKTPRRIVDDEDEEEQPLVVTEVWEVPDDEENDAQWQSFTHDLKGSKSKQKTPRRKAKRPGKGKEVEEVQAQEVEEAAAAKKAEEVEESKGGDEAAAATAPLDILNPQVLETAARLTGGSAGGGDRRVRVPARRHRARRGPRAQRGDHAAAPQNTRARRAGGDSRCRAPAAELRAMP